MTIRKIITAAAIASFLGLAGGSAYAADSLYANDSDDNVDDQGFAVAVDANYPGTVFVYNEDSDVNEGDILSTDGSELALLPQHIVNSLETN